MRRCWIGLPLALGLLAARLGAAERSVAAFVPADGLAALYYDGSHPGLKDCALARFFQEPEVLDALKSCMPLGEWLRTQFNKGAGYDLATPFGIALGCEGCVALLRPAAPREKLTGLAAVRVGTGQDRVRLEAERLLKTAIEQAQPGSVRQSEVGALKATSFRSPRGEDVIWAFDGPFALVAENEAMLRRMLDAAGPKLAWPGGAERPLLLLRCEPVPLIEAVAPDFARDARTALDAAGLSGMRSVSFAVVPRGKRLAVEFEAELAGEGKRVGLAKWLADGPPLDPELLKRAPARPTLCCLTMADIPGLWDTVWASLDGADPRAAQEGREAIARLEAQVGVRLREGILGPLGRGTLLVCAGDGVLGGYSVVVQRVRDGQTLEQNLLRLGQRLELALAGLDPRGQAIRTAPKTFAYRGHTCHYLWWTGLPALVLPGVAPCFTNLGDAFVFALHPLSLKSYLDFVEDRGPSVLDDPGFKALRAEVPEGATSLSYGSWPDTVVSAYNTVAPWFAALQGAGEIEGLPRGVDVANLPSSRLIRRYTGPGMTYSVVQDGRYRAVAFGEGIEWLSPQLGPLLAGAVVIGQLLPAFARPRTEALLIRNRNNLNQLAKGFATYLNEFGDNRFYPASTAELFDKGILPDAGVFVSPLDPDPPRLPNGLRCSYVSCFDRHPTRQFRDDFPPNAIMAWDRVPFARRGRAVLFFDSHVEYMDEARFGQLLAELDRLVPRLTRERAPGPPGPPKQEPGKAEF